jgi:oxygen-independent coproporphyrinogen-3 oxidase
MYIHIPYCDSKCYYCSFNSYVGKLDTRVKYIDALLVQFEREIERFDIKKGTIETLFIGGGTPSTISEKLYKNIFRELKYYLMDGAEITIEANPNSASKVWLESVREIGINRLSLGVQSFKDKKLNSLGRTHSAKMAMDAVKNSKAVGFSNISIDLIYNHIDDTETLIRRDIDTALKLGVSHISAYELTLEKKTPFANRFDVIKGGEEIGKFISSYIESQGLKRYEVSNYGRVSMHNLGYWQLKNYVGLGAGAVGFLKNIRIYPQKSIENYIKKPNLTSIEKLSDNDLVTERIFLGLRSDVGVDMTFLSKMVKERIALLVKEGKLRVEGSRVFNLNYFIADEIALFLLL